jgi:hypothetical protein
LRTTNYLVIYKEESKLKIVNAILEEGLKEFEQIFGFKYQSFTACNYVWPKKNRTNSFQKWYQCNTIENRAGYVTTK